MSEVSVSKWFIQTMWQYWRRALLILLASLIVAGASAAFPILWQMLIDRAAAGEVDYRLAILFFGLFIIEMVPIVYLLRTRFYNRYRFETRAHLFRHLLRLSIPFHKDRASTKVVQEASKGIYAGSSLIDMLLQGSVIANIPLALFSIWYVAQYSLPTIGILLGFMAIFWTCSHVIGKKAAQVEEEYNELDNDITTRQREILQHIETVKLHRAEDYEQAWYLAYGGKIWEMDNRLLWYYAWFNCLAGLAHALPFGIATLLFLPDVAQGKISVGTLVALQLYCMHAVSPAGVLGSIYQDLKTNVAKIKPALRLLQEEPSVIETKQPLELQPLRYQIALREVTFRYPDAAEPTLKNISLVIKAGEKVAIVGKTGSGKTTLARLLVRFYDPDHGQVNIDGVDLRHLSFDSLYREVCYVTQEVPIFSDTIGANVGYGLPNLPTDRLSEACRQASADFIFRKEQGLETKVGELGEKLSGGERQRLALARVFLRRPSVVILDEATSSLDQLTEREVQTAFDRLLSMNGGTTMIVIAHRITTVKNAGRIVVLDSGCIIDIGSHKELLQRCSLYQDLCRGMAT